MNASFYGVYARK